MCKEYGKPFRKNCIIENGPYFFEGVKKSIIQQSKSHVMLPSLSLIQLFCRFGGYPLESAHTLIKSLLIKPRDGSLQCLDGNHRNSPRSHDIIDYFLLPLIMPRSISRRCAGIEDKYIENMWGSLSSLNINTWILHWGVFLGSIWGTTSLPVKMTIVNTAVNALNHLQYIPNIEAYWQYHRI